MRKTREENLFVSMQQRLQQAVLNDTERRELLAQLDLHVSSQEILVFEFGFIEVKYWAGATADTPRRIAQKLQ